MLLTNRFNSCPSRKHECFPVASRSFGYWQWCLGIVTFQGSPMDVTVSGRKAHQAIIYYVNFYQHERSSNLCSPDYCRLFVLYYVLWLTGHWKISSVVSSSFVRFYQDSPAARSTWNWSPFFWVSIPTKCALAARVGSFSKLWELDQKGNTSAKSKQIPSS